MTISADASTADYTGNALEGVDVATTVDANYKYYVLSNEGALGFYKYNGTTLGDNKAFIKTAVAPARGFFTFDDTTGISTVANRQMSNANTLIFDLQGRRVVQATKGLYIVNGKKVILK